MTLANDGTGLVLGIALLLWVAFILSYIRYGNRFRAPAGRALMIMSVGYAAVLIPQILRHPFGITTATASFTYFQIGAVCLSAAGTLAILALMIRANGFLPWKRKKKGQK